MSQPIRKHSAGGVVLDGKKVLTITSLLRNETSLPKGTINDGESTEAAAIREVKEETGYDTDIIKKIDEYTFEFDWTDGKHYIKTVTYYLMKLSSVAPPEPDLQPGEDFQAEWVDVQEALTRFTYDEAKDALRTALSPRN